MFAGTLHGQGGLAGQGMDGSFITFNIFPTVHPGQVAAASTISFSACRDWAALGSRSRQETSSSLRLKKCRLGWTPAGTTCSRKLRINWSPLSVITLSLCGSADLIVFVAQQAEVGDGQFVGVAAKIIDDLLRSAEMTAEDDSYRNRA